MAKKKFNFSIGRKIVFTLLGILLVGAVALAVRYFISNKKPQNTNQPTAVVTEEGAKVGKDEITVNIPADSLPVGASIEVKKASEKPPLEENTKYASDIYEIEASEDLKGSTVIEIDFDPKKFKDTDSLYIAYWDGESWIPADGFIDLQRNKAVVQTDHLSFWSVLSNTISNIWEDKIEPVYWVDVPQDLKTKIADDLELYQEDMRAIEHAQFSSLTKLATFTLGIANQLVEVSSILGGIDSMEELGTSLVEKVTEDSAKKQGEYGELAVEVYEAGKTGYAVGTVLGHAVFKTGLATAQLQAAAPQILGYILEKEMAYINANTSDLFEYLALYDSGSLERINTYIFFYDKEIPDRLRTRGVVMYYWAPTYKKWQKGKNVGTMSDVLLKVLETKPQETQQQTTQTTTQAKSLNYSKSAFPNKLGGFNRSVLEEYSQSYGCYEDIDIKPQHEIQAIFSKEPYTAPSIAVSVFKFSSASEAKASIEKCMKWGSGLAGADMRLGKEEDFMGYPRINEYMGSDRGLLHVGTNVIVDNYLITVSIEKGDGGKGSLAEHNEAMQVILDALIQ